MLESKLSFLAGDLERILKSYGRPIPPDTLASLIKEVEVESEDNVREHSSFYSVAGSDVFECAKKYNTIFKFYGDNISLKAFERDFWFNEIFNLLEKENEPMEIEQIIHSLANKYQEKFSIRLSDSRRLSDWLFFPEDVHEMIEQMTNTFSYEFTREYEKTGRLEKRVLKKIGLRAWLPESISIVDEITQLLGDNKNSLDINRLLYQINDRKKYYKEDHSDITEEELEEQIKKYPEKFKLEDGIVELIKTNPLEVL